MGGRIAPGIKGRIGWHVARNARASLSDSRPGRAAALRFIGPADDPRFEVARLETRLGRQSHCFLLVLLGKSHPSHLVAPDFDCELANLLQDSALIPLLDEGQIGAAEEPKRAVDAAQLISDELVSRDVEVATNYVSRRALFIHLQLRPREHPAPGGVFVLDSELLLENRPGMLPILGYPLPHFRQVIW